MAVKIAVNQGRGRWLTNDPLGEQSGFNLYIFVLNNPVNSVDLLGREQIDEIFWDQPDDIDLTPVAEALKSWAETRILDLAKSIGKRITEIPQMFSHPLGPVGYDLENYYMVGVSLFTTFRLEGTEALIKEVSPDAYTIYVHGIKDDEGGAAGIRVMLDVAVVILAGKCPKNIINRKIIPKDIGIKADLLESLQVSFRLKKNGSAVFKFDHIGGKTGAKNAKQIIDNLIKTAKEAGANKLIIEGNVRNERLKAILMKRYGFQTRGNRSWLEIKDL